MRSKDVRSAFQNRLGTIQLGCELPTAGVVRCTCQQVAHALVDALDTGLPC